MEFHKFTGRLCEVKDINQGHYMCLRFHLNRKVDHSGVSGVSNNIAEGVLFEDGQVVIHWNTEHSSINMYKSVADLIHIHGHGGDTTVVFDDPLPICEGDKKSE